MGFVHMDEDEAELYDLSEMEFDISQQLLRSLQCLLYETGVIDLRPSRPISTRR